MDIKPRSSSQSETTMYLKSFYSVEAEDADNTPERDALYRWAMGEIRCSQRIQRISQMVSHGTSSPMVFTALPAKPMSFRAGTQDTECRSVLR